MLKFLDEKALNIGRCVDMWELKLRGMESHDCHVIMERFLSIVFRDLLSNYVWNALIEVSLLF